MSDIDIIREKLQELILKHNELARAVENIAEAMELINSAILGMGPRPEKPENFDS
jgi:hypothetical protein